MAEDQLESLLFVAREVYVYQIPPRQSNAGYRAADWQQEPMWKGRLRVMEIGSDAPTKCLINLEDKDSGELFAQSPYQPTKQNPHGGCEAVLDSSRYFVLTVVDQQSGQKAYIGMGFPERTESFDFNVALQDWSKRQSPPKLSSASTSSSSSSSSTASPHLPPGGSRDFSLKEGETISIKLGGSSAIKKPKNADLTGGVGGGGLGAFKLAPPPPPPPRGR
ncbi:adaptin-ear-binding coat-associated family protein [Sporobolomyces salmoneus]|uniref:adaptin-ear-binding coat-associated family protein n=1 Tax=Sporobolomyces salmoneus TaxID=183962 RepID=UPI00316E70F0